MGKERSSHESLPGLSFLHMYVCGVYMCVHMCRNTHVCAGGSRMTKGSSVLLTLYSEVGFSPEPGVL